ncbi:MAG: lipocalin family protein [Microthrixaceae bacterium]
MMRKTRSLFAIPLAIFAAATLAACTAMGPVRTSTVDSVDPERYLGTWYEVGSVKQFFSIGLVNVTADYQLNEDGTIRVENRGEYFTDGGPESRIVGSAAAVDETFTKLNVTFVGTAQPNPPGNYWIVALDDDYQWAVVSDPTGTSAFFLSRTPQVSDEQYAEFMQLAEEAGVQTGGITRTQQFAD